MATQEMTRRSWRNSLYARAALFTLVGGGSLFGAILVQSWVMVQGTVDRLLQERMSLAVTTGRYVEQVVDHDLDLLWGGAQGGLSALTAGVAFSAESRQALGVAYQHTVFTEGAFVLDRAGKAIVAVPEEDPNRLMRGVDMQSLIDRAGLRDEPVSSGLIRLPVGNRPVLVILKAFRSGEGEVVGYIGGFLSPASNNLLKAFIGPDSGFRTSGIMQLVDMHGTVVASTEPTSLFEKTDHGDLLREAIVNRKELKGRCHACHEGKNETKVARRSEVLAFAPLPRLELGVAVRQSEGQALAPAFSLQTKLMVLGLAFVFIFFFFVVLAVHSVVAPVTRLTQIVRDLEDLDKDIQIPSFGRDEVGELAQVLGRLRTRVVSSMGDLRRQERILEQEVEVTQKNLQVLEDVAALGGKGLPMEAVLRSCLESFLRFLDIQAGAILLTREQEKYCVGQGISPALGATLIDKGLELIQRESGHTGVARAGSVRAHLVEHEDLHNVLVVELPSVQGIVLSAALVGLTPESQEFEERRVKSLLHQILMSATSVLLHQQEAAKNKQSRDFLKKILQAQEEERRRIARELHDTLAQDLAAHRLELERVVRQAGDQSGSAESRVRLEGLEKSAQAMLVGLRQLLLDLRPSVLDTLGFVQALQSYLERLKRDHGIRGTLSVEDEDLGLSKEMEVSLFRIFQEGMQNVIQHSKAENFLVSIGKQRDYLRMVLEDDGEGFDVGVLEAEAAPDGKGLGLLGIRERTHLLGGVFRLDSSPGEGTCLEIQIPSKLEEKA